ncbi:transcription antitermination factor NusB [Bdellovibrio sp. HCB185ZH]|uniref:transcription antitermination factor NusB n=1 Tax=Bdellovibrio TaxID=958 RepID=UPI0015E980DE|nr:transcription antitermination factor NusB [Bdellovibrio sp. KM01]QLY24530.1 transcription antitermination factor NusB [Bdellovibrio sp. KM01]
MKLTARRQARELALQILFQTEFTPTISVRTFMDVFEESYDAETISYADLLIKGVQENKAAVDSKIQASSAHWKVERMATIDRNILRIAVWEMKFSADPIKENIAINEAVEIAKKYGTSDSASFVNGLLDQVSKVH